MNQLSDFEFQDAVLSQSKEPTEFAAQKDVLTLAKIRGNEYLMDCQTFGRWCPTRIGFVFTLTAHKQLRDKWAAIDKERGLPDLMKNFMMGKR